MVPFERALMSSYKPSIVTFPLSFVLQHTTFSTSTPVSPKFPYVPLGVGGWPLGYKERRCWANCQLVSKISKSNLCDHNPPMLETDGQTDRRTDRRHAITIPRFALVHHTVKILAITCLIDSKIKNNTVNKMVKKFEINF